jgi:hypothetical protein
MDGGITAAAAEGQLRRRSVDVALLADGQIIQLFHVSYFSFS